MSERQPVLGGQFKTLKYRPDFPDRFGCIEDARAFCREFFAWYNNEHHHSGSACSPRTTSTTAAPQSLAGRAAVLDAAYAAHPERFVRARHGRCYCRTRSGSTRRPKEVPS